MTNLSRRDRIPFETTLGLRYETRAGQLRSVLEDVKVLLTAHSKVDTQYHSLKVFFSNFGDYSLDVRVKAYVKTGSWDEFQSIREELLFGIMDILEARGVSLAFPSRTTYLEKVHSPLPITEEA
jgi:MscS family membrane protein